MEPITYLRAEDEVEDEEDAATAEFVTGLAKSLIDNTYQQIKDEPQPPKEEVKQEDPREQTPSAQPANVPVAGPQQPVLSKKKQKNKKKAQQKLQQQQAAQQAKAAAEAAK